MTSHHPALAKLSYVAAPRPFYDTSHRTLGASCTGKPAPQHRELLQRNPPTCCDQITDDFSKAPNLLLIVGEHATSPRLVRASRGLLRQVRKPGNIARTVYIRGHRISCFANPTARRSARPFAAGSGCSDTGSAAHSALPAGLRVNHTSGTRQVVS